MKKKEKKLNKKKKLKQKISDLIRSKAKNRFET